MGAAALDIHTVEEVSVRGEELTCVAKVLSRETGAVKQVSDCIFTFQEGQVTKYFQTNRDSMPAESTNKTAAETTVEEPAAAAAAAAASAEEEEKEEAEPDETTPPPPPSSSSSSSSAPPASS